MLSWLRGVIPAVITPFDAQGRIEEKKLRDEIEFHLSCGVTALCAGGTTGEGAGLSPDEVYQLNRIFVDQAQERALVIGGVIPDTTDEVVRVGLAAKEAGAAALQVIAAVKQSGSNLHQVADMVYRFGKRIPILSAVDDLLYPSFVLGACGTLSAIASVLPRQCVELYEAVQDGNHLRALELHHQLLVVWRALEDMSGFAGRIKCAIELQGRPAGLPRHPHRAARNDGRILVRQAFEEAGIPLTVAESA